ncbi:hypothetical protein [Plantibacter sp. CFBP 8775]|uniref:hypothetical protein n=1 Tax=Plantibacter sp. CFBP 8775 TaxID=2774038 RepID=UPI00177FCFA4|nr:hypothetical protein [Plantibacter sp. CFBP 8775]MBD8104784.1 hypothetical protein [Plantibacter sp. CFBP 8775]
MAWFRARPGDGNEWVYYNTDHIAAVATKTLSHDRRPTVFLELTFATGKTTDVRLGSYDQSSVLQKLHDVFGQTVKLE